MTRTAVRRKEKKRAVVPRVKPTRKTSERAIYLGVLVVGFFSVMLASLFMGLQNWPILSVVYLALIAYIIAFDTWLVYRGKHLSNWHQAMAKLPLRFVGYGTKEGKPLDAAHDHPEVFRALMIFVVASVVVLAGLGYLAARSLM
jgi:hypothetical protein